MTNTGNISSDDKPVYELTSEGCEDLGHCHAARSLRQETTLTEDGKRRVCHRPAGWGTSHPGTGPCKLHMGNVRNVVKAAQAEQARQAVETLGLPVDTDPAEALLNEVRRTAGHVAWLGRVIRAMDDPEDLVYGLVEETVEPTIRDSDGQTVTRNTSGKYKAQQNVWYQMYAQERKHLVIASKAALDAGVSERMVRVMEQVADTFITMMENVFTEIGLTGEQRLAAGTAMIRELQMVAGEAT